MFLMIKLLLAYHFTFEFEHEDANSPNSWCEKKLLLKQSDQNITLVWSTTFLTEIVDLT